MIEGVKIIQLRRMCDERGIVSHMLKNTDENFENFGEIYFSTIYPNVVKAWHLHKKMKLNYCCILGNIKLVLYDNRIGSKTKGYISEIYIGEDNYCLVHIPAGIYNGFKAVGNKKAIVANCSTYSYDPEEIIRVPFNTKKIKYNWELKNG